MRKALATKRRVLCAVILLCLTLLSGFTTAPVLRHNQERQAAPTELVSKNSPQHQAVAYPIFESDSQLHFSISCREIATRLALFELKVEVQFAENLKSEMLAKRLKIELLRLTSGYSKLADTYLIRG